MKKPKKWVLYESIYIEFVCYKLNKDLFLFKMVTNKHNLNRESMHIRRQECRREWEEKSHPLTSIWSYWSKY
jgi:hypothetical protein